MKIKTNKISTNLLHLTPFKKNKLTIIYLHGFTCNAEEWKEVSNFIDKKFNQVAIDLIGHGKTDSPDNLTYYSAENIIKQILQIIKYLKLDEVILLGYSMGGRAALSFAVSHPGRTKALILEGTSCGIEDPEERKTRIESDNNIARFIEENSIEVFVDRWMNLEIFASQKKLGVEKLKIIREQKLLNTTKGLANSLRGFGTGEMPYLGHDLDRINSPVLLITGNLDKKFTSINSRLAYKLINAKHVIIKDTGHNVHLEKPEEFAGRVNEFLLTIS